MIGDVPDVPQPTTVVGVAAADVESDASFPCAGAVIMVMDSITVPASTATF
ncbi:hypothetical protein QNO08_07975 [Arthrobacter sp. zg-Y820]|uniref:hypothetical protein n=1 Tax=unclassified Arthrobacter TaxID=235627 RepID=UPI001E2A6F65|nr:MULTISPECIES: hypothetical protein [unclassified Arthrobacter]WIB10942.1 hypothetical protein QNO08_07975 [Arthrobacter sp. zg-Y820]